MIRSLIAAIAALCLAAPAAAETAPPASATPKAADRIRVKADTVAPARPTMLIGNGKPLLLSAGGADTIFEVYGQERVVGGAGVDTIRGIGIVVLPDGVENAVAIGTVAGALVGNDGANRFSSEVAGKAVWVHPGKGADLVVIDPTNGPWTIVLDADDPMPAVVGWRDGVDAVRDHGGKRTTANVERLSRSRLGAVLLDDRFAAGLDPKVWHPTLNADGTGRKINAGELQRFADVGQATHGFSPNGLRLTALPAVDGVYPSGAAATKDLFYTGDALNEAELTLPIGRGKWSAYWLMPQKVGARTPAWPDAGEVDIVEALGVPFVGYQTLHFRNDLGGQSQVQVRVLAPRRARWQVLVTPAEFIFAVDDMVTLHAPRRAPMVGPWRTILNLAVGGKWAGDPDATSIFPTDLLVHRVRVTELLAAAATPAPPVPTAQPEQLTINGQVYSRQP